MIPNNKILLVEDDRNLGYVLSEYLTISDFDVTWARDGQEALDLITARSYSLCILDVMLPSMSGFDLAEKIAASGVVQPYIFLTAKNLKVDKLRGFKLGCDDYITKPVDEEELVARIQAVLRRNAGPNQNLNTLIGFGISTFNPATKLLRSENRELRLTTKESEVLHLLLLHRNTLLDREKSLKMVWGSNDYFNSRSMDVIISRLRKHLSYDTGVKITNIHGKGYMLETLR